MIVGFWAFSKPVAPTCARPKLPCRTPDLHAGRFPTAVLLTQERLANDFLGRDACVIRLDADWDVVSAERVENLKNNALPENLAYVIYTSGSTGKPKR